MSLVKLIDDWFEKNKAEAKLKKLKEAFAVVEAAGYFVCNIQQRGGTNYLVDGKGNWHKIGKRA